MKKTEEKPVSAVKKQEKAKAVKKTERKPLSNPVKLTNEVGAPVADNENSITAGPRGPVVMRTPLNAILGYDRLALETDSGEDKNDYLKKIGQAGSTLLSLINDTLDLQKIETGTTTIHTAPVHCSEVVDGIITAVKPMMDARKINFRFENSKAVMTELYNDNKPIDLLTVQEKLKEKDVPPEMSGLDFIREIVENVPTSANVKAYAAIVHEKAAKRRLIKATEEIANTCYADKEDMK